MLVGALAGLALAPAAQADTFTNPARIQIGDEAPANPWPSAIPVSGMVGEITDIKIRLDGISHTHLDDVGVVAQAPSGQALLLMNGVGPIVTPPDLTQRRAQRGSRASTTGRSRSSSTSPCP